MRYRTIVADPPWIADRPTGWGKGTNGWGDLDYATMSIAEIQALPVRELADEICHLYLWVTSRHVEAAYGIARGWGFGGRDAGLEGSRPQLLTWCKEPCGIGPGGRFAQTTEFILFCRRGVEGRYLNRVPTTWWNWPRGTHSRKPDAFLDLVEQVSPGPYAELFARRARFGWDYPIGDQALGGVAA